jgi:hypothetical protein
VGEVKLPETTSEPEIEVVMPDEDIATPEFSPAAAPPPAAPSEPVIPSEPAVPSEPMAPAEPAAPAASALEAPAEPLYEDRIEAPSPFVAGPDDFHELSPERFQSLVQEVTTLEPAPADDEAALVAAAEAVEVADGEGDQPAIIPDDVDGAEPIVVSGFDPFAEPEVEIHEPGPPVRPQGPPRIEPEPSAAEPEPPAEELHSFEHPAGHAAEPDTFAPTADDEIELEFELEDGDDTAPASPFAGAPPPAVEPELEGVPEPMPVPEPEPEPSPMPEPAPMPPMDAELAAIEAASRREVDVSAEDNQLHLRLQGTGAIVESGQVRALDIEVPVPGSWVGNRRVTLQLRLTLTPDTEDGNDNGPTGTS